MMLKEKKLNLSLIGNILFFVAVGIYFLINRESLSSLLQVSLPMVLILMALKTTRIFVTGMFTKYTLEVFSKNISYKETHYLSLLSSIGNFFGPLLGGASIRAVYLKKKFNLSYSKFISTLHVFYLLTFMMNSTVGLVALYFSISSYGFMRGSALMLLVFSAILLAGLFVVVFPERYIHSFLKRLNFLPSKILKIINSLSAGWFLIIKHREVFNKLIVVNAAVLLLATLETSVLYWLFADSFSLGAVLMYTVFGSLSMIISITPGAIGIKEAIFLYTSSVLLLTNDEIIQMATVDRASTFIVLVILFLSMKKLKKNGSTQSLEAEV